MTNSSNTPRASVQMDRHLELAKMVRGAYMAKYNTVPEDEKLEALLEVWEIAFEECPTEDLDRVRRDTIRSGEFTLIEHFRAVWNRIAEDREYDARAKRDMAEADERWKQREINVAAAKAREAVQ